MFSMPLEDVPLRQRLVDGLRLLRPQLWARGRRGRIPPCLHEPVGKPWCAWQWSRADEHGWIRKTCMTLIDLRRPLLDASGGVDGLGVRVLLFRKSAATDVDLFIAATLANMRNRVFTSPGGVLNDLRRDRLQIPNIKTVCHRLEPTPLRPAWIWAPGRLQNTFANECFLDEIAAAAGDTTHFTCE